MIITNIIEKVSLQTIIKVPNYSSILDIRIYKGGYSDLYYEIFISENDNKEPSNKTIDIICMSSDSLDIRNKIPDDFIFFKLLPIEISRTANNYLIFIRENVDTSEKRNSVLEKII